MSAVTTWTPVTPFSPEEDLDVAWRKTIARCQALAKWELNDKQAPSVDEIIDKIQPAKKDEKNSTRDQAKVVVRSTLLCIQRFGQFAAQGASMVFGPSQQCFNAINFVLNVAQDYAAVFSNLTTLMERVSAFMERLRIHMESPATETKLDRRLRRPVYRVLEHFVLIMSISYKLTTGVRGKVKLGFKLTLLGDDDGVKDALARLETLVADVTGTEISVIVKDLSEAAKSLRGVERKVDYIATTLDAVKAMESRREDSEKDQKDLEMLRKALGVEDKKEPWQERQDELWRTHVPGSGKWLLDHRMPSLSRWADPSETSVNVITLKAEQNFGKSYLSSAVVNHLVTRYNRQSSKVAVAFYYFQKESSETRDSGSDTVNRALKAIIWQLLQIGEVGREYRRLVSRICNERPDLSKTVDLWRMLVTDHDRSLNATFFLVLDGVDAAKTEHGDPLARIVQDVMATSNESTQLKIRLLLTGRPDAIATIANQVTVKLPEIDLTLASNEAAINEPDLLLYAEDRLEKMPVFYDRKDAEKNTLKSRIKWVLARGVRGDYYNLIDKLAEISRAQNFDQLEEILTRASEDRSQVIGRKVADMNEKLLPDEIEEINELLIWVNAGLNWFTIEELTVALRLKSRQTNLFLPLEQRIRQRYSDLFVLDESENKPCLKLSSDDIEGFLSKNQDHTKARTDSNRPTNDKGFHEAEIALIQRAIKVHLNHVFGDEPSMYDKYGFDQFFESKRSPSNAKIHYHPEKAEVDISHLCLIALCDRSDDEEFASIQAYAFSYFGDHISNQMKEHGLDRIDAVAKQEIGRRLAKIFYEPYFIERWIEQWMTDAGYWIDESNLRDAVHAWLTDPEVQRGLQDNPREKKWVATLDDHRSIRILENVAKVSAQRWFASALGHNGQAISWLLDYHDQTRETRRQLPESTSVEAVEEVEIWAKALLQNESEVAQWHFVVGLSLNIMEHCAAAIPRLRQSLSLRPEFWRAEMELAIAIGESGDQVGGVAALEKLMDSRADGTDSDSTFQELYWSTILPTLGRWNTRLGRPAAAEDVARKLLEHGQKDAILDPELQETILNLTYLLAEQHKYSETLELLLQLSQKIDPASGDDWLSTVIIENVDVDTFNARILKAVALTNSSAVLADYGQKAIQVLIKADSRYKTTGVVRAIKLRTRLGLLWWRLGSSQDREEAINLWEEIVQHELGMEGWDIDLVGDCLESRCNAAAVLLPALLTRAMECGLQTSEAGQYIKRMESMSEINHDVARIAPFDYRLFLARMHCLLQQPVHAVDRLRDYMVVAIQITLESVVKGPVKLKNSVSGPSTIVTNLAGPRRLARAFLSLDDDVNALAAWGLFMSVFEPEDEVEEQEEESIVDKAEQHGTEQENEEQEGDQPEDPPPQADCVSQNPRAIEGAHDDDLQNSPANDATVSADDSSLNKSGRPSLPHIDTSKEALAEEGNDAERSLSPSVRSGIDQINFLNSPCSGLCDRFLAEPDDIYACKECLYVLLCAECYGKLKNGTLVTKPCDPMHSHLHVPPLDRKAWQERPEGKIYVGDGVMTVEEWLTGVMKKWDIEERCSTMRDRMNAARRKLLQLAKAKGALENWKEGSMSPMSRIRSA